MQLRPMVMLFPLSFLFLFYQHIYSRNVEVHVAVLIVRQTMWLSMYRWNYTNRWNYNFRWNYMCKWEYQYVTHNTLPIIQRIVYLQLFHVTYGSDVSISAVQWRTTLDFIFYGSVYGYINIFSIIFFISLLNFFSTASLCHISPIASMFHIRGNRDRQCGLYELPSSFIGRIGNTFQVNKNNLKKNVGGNTKVAPLSLCDRFPFPILLWHSGNGQQCVAANPVEHLELDGMRWWRLENAKQKQISFYLSSMHSQLITRCEMSGSAEISICRPDKIN